MEHLLSSLLLVALPGCFGFEVSGRQLSAERGAVRDGERRTNCARDASIGCKDARPHGREKFVLTNFF